MDHTMQDAADAFERVNRSQISAGPPRKQNQTATIRQETQLNAILSQIRDLGGLASANRERLTSSIDRMVGCIPETSGENEKQALSEGTIASIFLALSGLGEALRKTANDIDRLETIS